MRNSNKFGLLILTLVFTSASGILNAQIQAYVKGGFNLATQYYSEKTLDDGVTSGWEDPLPGIHFGTAVEWFLPLKFSLMGGFEYSRKGYANENPAESRFPKDLHIHYMAFPFSINYHLSDKFALGIGIEADYLLSKNMNFFDENSSDFRNWDYGGLFQIRYQLRSVEFGTIIYYGFPKVIDQENPFGLDYRHKAYNRNLQLYVAYVFKEK